jgi:hypothetical protein
MFHFTVVLLGVFCIILNGRSLRQVILAHSDDQIQTQEALAVTVK